MFKIKSNVFLFILILITSVSGNAEDMVHPHQNITWAEVSVRSTNRLINEWKQRISDENEKGNPSLDNIKELERSIKEAKFWLQDMQSILDGKKPSGKGIALHRQTAQQQIAKYQEGHPVYCNYKNLIRIYDHLEKGEPIGSYSCK